MRRFIINLAIALVVILPSTVVYSQLPKAPTASETFCRRLAKAETIAFTVQTFIPYSFMNHANTAVMSPAQRFDVKAMRPNLLSYVGTPTWTAMLAAKGKYRILVGAGLNVCRANSKGSIWISNDVHGYQNGPAFTTLTKVPKGEDDPIDAWLIFREADLRSGCKPAPDETLRGATATVYSGGDVDHTAVWKLYFDKKRGDLQQFSIFSMRKNGTAIEECRNVYSHWRLDVKFANSSFDTTPPPGYKPIPPYEEASKR